MITYFRGPHAFLSNFWLTQVVFEGATYPSSEHAYQAAKSLDPVVRDVVRKAGSPGIAKRMGRNVKLRTDWEDIKVGVMREILRSKFSAPDLREKLLATGNEELIEGNTWGDRIWGAVWNGEAWIGDNLLGKLLMEVRAECSK